MFELFEPAGDQDPFHSFLFADHFPTLVELSGENLTLLQFLGLATGRSQVTLNSASLDRVRRSRACVEAKAQSDDLYYGINTGFGALARVTIPKGNLQELQTNLLRSHACGVGVPLSEIVVRGVLALRIQTMLRGHSGVRVETIQLMSEFLNRRIHPVVPCKGSVGASGDLAPLAHIGIALIGEGEVFFQGKRLQTHEVLKQEGLVPLQPGAKEGLSLINGTQVMTSLGLLCLSKSQEMIFSADAICAMSLEALRGTATALDPRIHEIRLHKGQKKSADFMRNILQSGEDTLSESHKNCEKVQDPYSLRCAPQVHGASRDCIQYSLETLLREANSSTDNPLVFEESDEILSGGNFHGQPVAFALDFAALGLAEIASISERRTDKLITSSQSGLPAFLVENSGLNSGFMIPHVVAAALVSENKILCHPASIDSIPTSAQQEDHVSMGMTAALKLNQILVNVSRVLAVEALSAAQGLDLLKPLEPAPLVNDLKLQIRGLSAHYAKDRSLASDLENVSSLLMSGHFLTPTKEKNLIASDDFDLICK